MSFKWNPFTGELDRTLTDAEVQALVNDDYIRLDGTNSPTANIDWGGYNLSNVVIPDYVPYTGATGDIDLGAYDLTTTGDITAGNLSGTNTGDQTDISDFTGTKAEFDTACTDGNFAYSGGAFHDGFSDFVSNEHIDWTTSQSPTVIHADNYSKATRASLGLDTDDDVTFGNNVLTPAPSSDHTSSGNIASMTVGESVAFGDVLYMKSDGKLWKSDANASASMPIMAMAVATISADASGNVLLLGFARDDTWAWTVGGMVYASGTAGALTQTAPSATGDLVQVVGVATHSDRMYFNPNYAMVEVA